MLEAIPGFPPVYRDSPPMKPNSSDPLVIPYCVMTDQGEGQHRYTTLTNKINNGEGGGPDRTIHPIEIEIVADPSSGTDVLENYAMQLMFALRPFSITLEYRRPLGTDPETYQTYTSPVQLQRGQPCNRYKNLDIVVNGQRVESVYFVFNGMYKPFF